MTPKQTTKKRGRKPLSPEQRKKEVKVWVKPRDEQKVRDYVQRLNQNEC